MKVAILKKGVRKPSKFDYGMCQRVTMENLDTQTPRYVYLNMTDDVRSKWEQFIVEGNVLNVPVMPGSTNVNKFGQFQVIREVKNGSSE